MISLRVITLGSISQSFIRAGEQEYFTRLQRVAKIEVCELDGNIHSSQQDRHRADEQESDVAIRIAAKTAQQCLQRYPLCDQQLFQSKQLSTQLTMVANP